MSRIQSVFESLKQRGRKALIPFITAGDPNPNTTVPLMHAIADMGADIIEVGVPFSDPMADGPTIQRSSERALKHGVTLHHVLDMVTEFRTKNSSTPIVLMGYGNPIEAMGWEHFAKGCAHAGVDGVLTVDFPPEESREAFSFLHRCDIDPIFLLAPTTSDARIEQVAKLARGYVYYVSLRGVTGAGNLDLAAIADKIPRIRQYINLPIGVGFGIRDVDTANAVSKLCDGVVIGSRIVQEIENSAEECVISNVSGLVKEFSLAIN